MRSTYRLPRPSGHAPRRRPAGARPRTPAPNVPGVRPRSRLPRGDVDHRNMMRRLDQRRAGEMQQRSADARIVHMQMPVNHDRGSAGRAQIGFDVRPVRQIAGVLEPGLRELSLEIEHGIMGQHHWVAGLERRSPAPRSSVSIPSHLRARSVRWHRLLPLEGSRAQSSDHSRRSARTSTPFDRPDRHRNSPAPPAREHPNASARSRTDRERLRIGRFGQIAEQHQRVDLLRASTTPARHRAARPERGRSTVLCQTYGSASAGEQ